MSGKKVSIKREIKGYMNTTHENMMWAVVNFGLDPANMPVTSSLAPLEGYLTTVQSNLNAVRTLRASIANPTTGITADNKALKDLIAAGGTNVFAATYSYAIDNNDLTLAAKMKVTTSGLEDAKIETFIGVVQGGINAVTAVVGSLSGYGVTPTAVTTLQALVTELGTQTADPKQAIAFKRSVNVQIQNLLKSNLNMFYNNSDRIVTQLRATNAAYYNNYKGARKLFPHHLSTQGRFTVKYYSGAPVTVGEIFILGTDRSNALNSDGYALVDHIPFGSHQVTLSLPTGDHTYGPFDFKKGKSLSLFFTISDPTVAATVKVVEKDLEEVTK